MDCFRNKERAKKDLNHKTCKNGTSSFNSKLNKKFIFYFKKKKSVKDKVPSEIFFISIFLNVQILTTYNIFNFLIWLLKSIFFFFISLIHMCLLYLFCRIYYQINYFCGLILFLFSFFILISQFQLPFNTLKPLIYSVWTKSNFKKNIYSILSPFNAHEIWRRVNIFMWIVKYIFMISKLELCTALSLIHFMEKHNISLLD